MQNLEDNYERTLQDEAKELEQLLSKRNMFLAKQEEYSRKIRELGPLSSDAFETYDLELFGLMLSLPLFFFLEIVKCYVIDDFYIFFFH